jgi:hypothetical protein
MYINILTVRICSKMMYLETKLKKAFLLSQYQYQKPQKLLYQ